MRLTLCTFGSRGDVQPYLALGKGLQQAGFQVRIATSRYHEPLVRRHGLACLELTDASPQEILRSEGGLRWLETGGNPLANLRAMRDLAGDMLDQQTRVVLQLCEDADALLYAVTTMLVVAPIAEKLGIPAAGVWLQPFHPTRAFPSLLFPQWPRHLPLAGHYNRLSHEVQRRLSWHLMRDNFNAVRVRHLGLSPTRRPYDNQHLRPDPVVYGFSPQMIAKPADWDDRTAISGYWFLQDGEWRPSDALLDFLQDGPAPIYVGFGSMMERDAERTTEIILQALQGTGLRAVLLGGWAGLGERDLPDSVLRLDYAPHEWLFPRMRALVHHGGTGTVGAGLRAGRPALVIPRFADQPFWARRLHTLGVSPPPIAHKRLTVERLTRALLQLTTDSDLRQRAEVIGERLRAEKGVDEAVSFLTRALESSPRRRRDR
ncbi:MAG: glycosyltransferase family 1 protein [Anaerolineae bacterium]|nr:glycosyltransferase family 1 protein [Anaerolineae bacterium]